MDGVCNGGFVSGDNQPKAGSELITLYETAW